MRERGFTLLELMIVTAILSVFAALALPNLFSARMRARESAAVSVLRSIRSAQELFRERDLDHDGEHAYTDKLGDLVAAGAIDGFTLDNHPEVGPILSRRGYGFALAPPDPPNNLHYGFTAIATPLQFGKSGSRTFFLAEDGTIYYTTTDIFAHGGVPDPDLMIPLGE